MKKYCKTRLTPEQVQDIDARLERGASQVISLCDWNDPKKVAIAHALLERIDIIQLQLAVL